MEGSNSKTYKSRLFTSNVLLQKDELEEASLTISLTNLYNYMYKLMAEIRKLLYLPTLTPANWKLHSHANSRLRTQFSRLDEKCELWQLELKHFPKRCKLTPIRETKTPCNWKSKWVPDGTYPKSQISITLDLIAEHWIISFGSSELFETSLDIFGSLRKTSDMFVSSSEIMVLSS